MTSVPGLIFVENYLSADEERQLLEQIDRQAWSEELRRRVQHYGYRYDYRSRSIDASMRLGPVPPWLATLAARLAADDHMERTAEQVIVNEYQPGQGIAAHIDCVPCFGPIIASITLGAGCRMDFSDATASQRESLYLLPRSLLVLRKEARYQWRHGIAARRSDLHHGIRLQRGRRVSITFRTVLLD